MDLSRPPFPAGVFISGGFMAKPAPVVITGHPITRVPSERPSRPDITQDVKLFRRIQDGRHFSVDADCLGATTLNPGIGSKEWGELNLAHTPQDCERRIRVPESVAWVDLVAD